ncbi:Phosphatidylglycerophosphate synthase [Halapricum desulfuricans]|uniref:Phosphatidylglycerophosphate synthase n=1 Tax=Halapricum desulfuricans TaxID=2841257 RepID=A0A897NQE7_9EURY|nr:CDP-alcohol phosphatidyltransferase family protein [Halapricum desulfuricans]QSG13049.1 Phosphatidylglycerophosphate synthase [Halapricum desulfuricans]
MTERPTGSSLSVGTRVAFPLLGALALAVVLRGLYPPEWVDARILDPAVVAGLCLAGLLWYVSYRLVPSRTAGRPLGGLFGLANTLTLLRGALYAVVAGFVVVPPDTRLAWVPALAYGSGIVLDKLDGTVARTIGQETVLGERLDMAFDTFGFVAAPLVAVVWGLLPAWYLSLSAARYVYRGGLGWRRRRGRPLYDPPDSDLGRYLAGVQMVFLTAALTPAVPTELVWIAAPFVLAPSLGVFVRDFLVVTGRLSGPEQ